MNLVLQMCAASCLRDHEAWGRVPIERMCWRLGSLQEAVLTFAKESSAFLDIFGLSEYVCCLLMLGGPSRWRRRHGCQTAWSLSGHMPYLWIWTALDKIVSMLYILPVNFGASVRFS